MDVDEDYRSRLGGACNRLIGLRKSRYRKGQKAVLDFEVDLSSRFRLEKHSSIRPL